VKAAKEAGGKDYGACVVYALLVNKRWFKKQSMLELWDADLHNIRATACEVIAKHLYGLPILLESRKRANGVTGSRPRTTRNISYKMCY
jgi:hypothetical protein